MATEYHNFLKGKTFLSLKILNKKVNLQALNALSSLLSIGISEVTGGVALVDCTYKKVLAGVGSARIF